MKSALVLAPTRRDYLDVQEEKRVREAEQSLQANLGLVDLSGKRFLDSLGDESV